MCRMWKNMSEVELKEHLEQLYDKFLNGEEAAAKEFAAYVRYAFGIR